MRNFIGTAKITVDGKKTSFVSSCEAETYEAAFSKLYQEYLDMKPLPGDRALLVEELFV
jgi:hypothetical protein